MTDFYSISRNIPAIQQFTDGFKTITGFFELMCSKTVLFEKEFCSATPLTADMFLSYFKINLSDMGTNKRILENKTLSFLRDLLIDCEGN